MKQVTLYCPHCGSDNPAGAYFCNMCAAPLRSDAEDFSEGFKDPSRIPLISMATAFGVVAALSLIVNVALISQRVPSSNGTTAISANNHQSPTPVQTVTPLPSPSATIAVTNRASKTKTKPTPITDADYSIPSDEPAYQPTPYQRTEGSALPKLPPPDRYNPTDSGHIYIRGPRGGCYYINRNGNKTYVDRSMCD